MSSVSPPVTKNALRQLDWARVELAPAGASEIPLGAQGTWTERDMHAHTHRTCKPERWQMSLQALPAGAQGGDLNLNRWQVSQPGRGNCRKTY